MDTEKYLSLPSSWSKEQTCLLLEELEKHPMLYDQTHPLYLFKEQRLAALRKIIEKLRPYKPKLTPRDILNKIKSLRSQCCREKKRIRNALVTGKKYTPKLWCYNMSTFLSVTGYGKSSITSPEEDDDVEDAGDECYDDESNNPMESFEEIEIEPVKQRSNIEPQNDSSHRVLHKKCLSLVECLTKQMKNFENEGSTQQLSSTPNTFLGLMVESELSKVTEEIYDDAKWKIIRILEEASKKNREVKTHPVQISLPTTSPSIQSTNPGANPRMTVVFKNPPIFFRPNNMQITGSSQNK